MWKICRGDAGELRNLERFAVENCGP